MPTQALSLWENLGRNSGIGVRTDLTLGVEVNMDVTPGKRLEPRAMTSLKRCAGVGLEQGAVKGLASGVETGMDSGTE